ncbi:TonB-dependent receptor [Pedobacter frigiditerrae]|uniref:SusC/RagA family TonB-linked outer membrane protein n=1 Tax=Pedobacter frigiditerrae TaxID=2530452 RepID=UPI00292D4E84|nr:TonB-dependent receptor [Pedobacter frigiditerrae]
MNLNSYSNQRCWRKGLFSRKLLKLGLSTLAIVAFVNNVKAMDTNLRNASKNKISVAKKFDTIITGKVTDEKGEVLPGVGIKLKNGTATATTDANGNFSISIPSNVTNPVLVISYIGFATVEKSVSGQTTVNIQLISTTNDLNEVVVVGYNTVRKSDLTGAVSSVNAEQIRSRPVQNALQAIQGKAAGVDITSNERPGSVGSILIRGMRSINASNSPLFVVDGIPLSAGGIEAINPNDIETIDILKDASATAIYGSRGANGVVLVTTKTGKAGRLTLDYVGTTNFETIQDRTRMMNSAEYIEFRRNATRVLPTNNALYYPTAFATQASDRKIFAGDPYVLENIDKGWVNGVFDGSLVPTTDWTGLVKQTGITHDHSLSVSGGTDKMKAYGSFGYLNQLGTQLGQDYNRYSTKLSVEINPVKWFKMGLNVTGSYGLQNYGFSTGNATGPTSLYGAAQGMLPLAVPYDVNGNRINLPGADIGILNPVGEELYNVNLTKILRTIGSVYAELNLLKGLKYRINFGPDFLNSYNGRYQDAKAINRGAGEPGSTNSASLTQNNRFAYTLDHLLYYDKTIKKHNFGVTLLQSSSRFKQESSSMEGTKIPLSKPLWYGLGGANIPSLDRFSTDLSENSLISYMARVNYSFNSKYLLTASARWDGASQLAPGNKWDFFPSAAIAWRIDQEDFLKNIKWVDQLKLRLGVGSVGNSAIAYGTTLGKLQPLTYTFGSSVQTGYVSSDASLANPITLPNKALGWEHTLQYNLGLDFSIVKGRVGGSIDLYKSTTTDLLLEKPIPSINGYTSSFDNIGETQNKGIDITLNTVNLQKKDFSWSTTISFSASKDRITKLANGDVVASNLFIGERVRVAYDFVKVGIWQNTPEDLVEMGKFNANLPAASAFKPGSIRVMDFNGDYKIDANFDRRVRGSYTPSWTGGMTNTFNYKNFDLSIFIISRNNFLIATGAEVLQGRYAQRLVDYWTPTNPTNNYPAPNYGNAIGDTYRTSMNYQDASFVKIRNISLGYIFPQSIAKKLTLSKLRVYAQVLNPGLIYSNVDWIDPDAAFASNNSVSSTFNRGFVFGLNVGL